MEGSFRNGEGYFLCSRIELGFCNRHTIGEDFHRSSGGRVGFQLHCDSPAVIVGHQPQVCNVHRLQRFQPYGLPDATLRRVKHTARRQCLLTAGLYTVAGGVLYGDPQIVHPGAQRLRDVQRKRPVAPAVAAHNVVIDPDGTGVVHRAEMQQQTSARGHNRAGKRPVIVQALPRLQRAPHARGRTFRRVWHQNLGLHSLGGRQFCIRREGAIPPAVQVVPAFPMQHRSRIFREWNGINHNSFPFCTSLQCVIDIQSV